MTVLGIEELLRRVREEKLIEGLAERELTNPEGCGFDLRIGKLYKPTSSGFLGVNKRETSNVELIGEYKEGESRLVTIKPSEYYLMETVERINNPLDLSPEIKHRTTLFRSGVVIYNSHVGPGYQGTLTFGIKNQGDYDFKLEMGARVVHVTFHLIEGKLKRGYEGQWQGGRVATEGKETQI